MEICAQGGGSPCMHPNCMARTLPMHMCQFQDPMRAEVNSNSMTSVVAAETENH